MEDLKECPFCGDDNPLLTYQGGRYGTFGWVECGLCGARTRTYAVHGIPDCQEDIKFWYQNGFRRAIDSWNRRVE